jgi:hypothetical protein
MSRDNAAVVIFTAKSIESILLHGGTRSWRLDRNHARQCAFAVLTRNANAEWVEGNEPHHSAFLVGKISDVVPTTDPDSQEDRYLIRFSQYARVSIPDVWQGNRNPVWYSSLEKLGIDPLRLKWEEMGEVADPSTASAQSIAHSAAPLSLAEAKKGLAITFGVMPEAIEITIRA